MISSSTSNWIDKLSKAIADALIEFREQIRDQIELFAVDCHPWNGAIVLALLTASETRKDPSLVDSTEMAAWKHYDFGSVLSSWKAVLTLGSDMRTTYNNSEEDRALVAEQYLLACAAAVATKSVQEALSKYHLSDTFRIHVRHPDSEMEYYPPNQQ